MSQEDDLRGLAKVMDFMRALSVLFVVVNIYWFCYPSIREWNVILLKVPCYNKGLYWLYHQYKGLLRQLQNGVQTR